MAEQNNLEGINKNSDVSSDKHLLGKIIAIIFMAIDTIALVVFFISISVNEYGHMQLFSFNNKSRPTTAPTYSTSQVPEWITTAKHTENKLLYHINCQIGKQAGTSCTEIASVTYEQIGQDLYNFYISGYAGSKIYKLSITNLSTTEDIQSYVIDMPYSSMDAYEYTLSYTDFISMDVTNRSTMYYSKGPDDKELMSGYYYDDHMFFVYMEHERKPLPANEEADQIYKHGSLLEDYYYYLKDVKGN